MFKWTLFNKKFLIEIDCNGENEAYREGLSSSCGIPTCENKDTFGAPNRFCTYDYVSSCICINNTFRHTNGNCVTKDQCP